MRFRPIPFRTARQLFAELASRSLPDRGERLRPKPGSLGGLSTPSWAAVLLRQPPRADERAVAGARAPLWRHEPAFDDASVSWRHGEGNPAGPLPLLATSGPFPTNPGGTELFDGETLSTSSAGGLAWPCRLGEVSGLNCGPHRPGRAGDGSARWRQPDASSGGPGHTRSTGYLDSHRAGAGAPELLVLDSTPGPLGLPSPAELNPGNEALAPARRPVCPCQASIEPTESAAPVLAMPRSTGQLDPSTLAGNTQSSPTGTDDDPLMADLLPGEITPLTRGLTTPRPGPAR